MQKTAVDRGEELLNNPPSRDMDSLQEYVTNLRMSKRDLNAELNDPRTRMGDRDIMKTASMLGEVEDKLLTAEALLEMVRNEVPQYEIVEAHAEAEGDFDVEQSVNNLAVAAAASTIGQNNYTRLARAIQIYQENLEPILDQRYLDFPREMFTAKVSTLIAMKDNELAKIAAETFPTKEWIGPDPEPYGGEGDLGHIPTHFEKDETTKPEDKDIDGTFEDALEKERKFRGIEKAEGKASTAAKTADATNSTPGSHEPAASSDGGAQLQAKPPEPAEAFETTMLEGGESNGAPRGPNRGKGDDVPAYSTPKDKLTAALKLSSKYDNMSAEDALAIVNTVFASEVDEDEDDSEKAGDDHDGHEDQSVDSQTEETEEKDDNLEGLFGDDE